MTKLYSNLAEVYHEMYQSIFNYKKEFNFYNKILKKYRCKKILEIGCGSGNLATKFLERGYNYTGLDLANDMLKIAKRIENRATFIRGDMRKLNLKQKFDAIIISGRSFTYMTTNDDVIKSLKSINGHLRKGGILIFDNFNAKQIIGNFRKKTIQISKYNNKTYRRVSENSLNLNQGWTWNWNATYFLKEDGRKEKLIGKDKTVLRAFTKDELELFLKINGFKIVSFVQDSFTIVSEKV